MVEFSALLSPEFWGKWRSPLEGTYPCPSIAIARPLPFAFEGEGEGPQAPKTSPGWYKGNPPWTFDTGSLSCAVWKFISVKDPLIADGKLGDEEGGRE